MTSLMLDITAAVIAKLLSLCITAASCYAVHTSKYGLTQNVAIMYTSVACMLWYMSPVIAGQLLEVHLDACA